MRTRIGLAALVLLVAASLLSAADLSWRKKLDQQLPLLGHRNWIVVADSAYPWQTAPGIETIYTGEQQLDVLEAVLKALSQTRHVRPAVYTDAELAHVSEEDAKGISNYRAELKKLLAGREAQSLPHEQIIAKLDEAGKTFHVLLLKTKLTIPYTSVFIRLDCGYWDAASEQKLREKIEKKAGEK
jgi:RbsD/FucU transport protein family protein